MTLPNQIAPHAIQERCIRLIQTERLVLRAPRAQDAKTIAALVNDRRIAENTLRIRMGSPMRNALSLASTQAPARPYFSSSDVMTRCSAPAELPSVPEIRPSSDIGSPLHSGAMATPPKRRVP